MRKLFLEVKLS